MLEWEDVIVAETIEELGVLLPARIPSVRKPKVRTPARYLDITCAFDIETTNSDTDGFAYSFQTCIGRAVWLPRYVEDWIAGVEYLCQRYNVSDRNRLVLYVHNLGYEFTYLCQILLDRWGDADTLYTRSRKPLYMRFSNGVELRDSFKLFQKSLAKATKGVPHAKRAGDLDFSVWRTPDTPLTGSDLGYCICDVLGLCEAIDRLKAERKYNQATLPLTNTAMVIDDINKSIRGDRKVHEIMRGLDLDRQQMQIAYNCMAGGDTHGARWYAGRTLKNCNSADFKSAHPSQQLLWPFPAGHPITMPPGADEGLLMQYIRMGYGWCGKLLIADLQVKPECPDPTISVSKCTAIQGARGKDNGRLLGADGCSVWMDSNDFQRFRGAYDFLGLELAEGFCFKLAYLPDSFRGVILKYFSIKEGHHDSPDYMFYKICVNTIFGACAQKTIRDEYAMSLVTGVPEWDKTTWQENLTGKTDEEIAKSQAMKFPFLWGLWTSSMSRLKLWEMLKAVGWERVIYWDTDSCKYIGEKAPGLVPYNETIREQCKARRCVVKNTDGKPVYIGSAEDEHPDSRFGYRRFRFLHAKCYAVELADGTVECTISGVAKDCGVRALDGDIDNLADGLLIKPAGGQCLTYHDAPLRLRRDFARPTVSASWVVMTPREYEVAADMWQVLEQEVEA